MRDRPLVVAAITFVAGLLIQQQLLLSRPLLVLLAVGGSALIYASRRTRLAYPWAIALVLVGLLRMQMAQHPSAPLSDVRHLPDRFLASVTFRVLSRAETTPPAISPLVVEAFAMRSGVVDLPLHGRLRVTVRQPHEIRIGQIYRARLRIDVIRPPANPGQFDRRRWWQRQGIYRSAIAHGPLLRLSDGAEPFAERLQQRISKRLRWLKPSSLAVARAIVLGRSTLPDELRRRYASSGLAHILAISGLHLGIVALWLYTLLRCLCSLVSPLAERVAPARVAAVITLPCVWWYCLFTGAKSSTLRAATMVSLLLAATVWERRADLPSTVGFAALALLMWDPWQLTRAGFQLSFSAVIAIVWVLRSEHRLSLTPTPAWKQRLRVAWRVSLAASIATAPIAWSHFCLLTPLAPLPNLLLVPVATLWLVPAGMLLLLSELMHLQLWGVPSTLLAWGVEVLNGGALLASWLPLSVETGQPSALATAALGAVSSASLARLCATVWQVRRRNQWLLATLLLALALVSLQHWRDVRRETLRVTFLSVGQGDSTVVEFPDGRVMVVDGGGSHGWDPGRGVVGPFLRSRGHQRIDVVAVTHGDWDHIGGVFHLLQRFRVAQLWLASGLDDGKAMRRLIALAQSRGVTVVVPRGRREFGGATVDVLHPSDEQVAGRFARNDRSLTLRIRYRQFSLLLPGDIEADAETHLLKSRARLSALMIKVPHHGSSTSSTPGFLKAVCPRYAVFSTGRRNRFRFPRPRIVGRYDGLRVRHWNTASGGAVLLSTDGERLRIVPFRSGHGNRSSPLGDRKAVVVDTRLPRVADRHSDSRRQRRCRDEAGQHRSLPFLNGHLRK